MSASTSKSVPKEIEGERSRERRHFPKFDDLPDDGVVRQPQVLDVCGFGASTLWRSIRRGEFPRPLRLTQRAVGWRIRDIRAWLESRHAS